MKSNWQGSSSFASLEGLRRAKGSSSLATRARGARDRGGGRRRRWTRTADSRGTPVERRPARQGPAPAEPAAARPLSAISTATARHCCDVRDMDETGRKRPLEDDQPASPPSSLTKRPRTQLAAGQRQLGRSSDAESSSSSETSSLSSRDSSDTSSSAEDDSNEESTSSAGTSSSSSSSSCPSPSSSESDDSEGSEAEEAEDDVDGLDGGHDEAAIEYVPARAKPRIHRVQTDSGILSRVSSFLPKLKAANEDLQRDIAAGRAKDVVMDDVDEEQGEGQYIEMVGFSSNKRNGNFSCVGKVLTADPA